MPDKIRIPLAEHETRDISERFIWMTVAATGVMLLGCGALTLWLYPDSRLDRTLHLPLPVYPEPRLQPDPSADMRRFYLSEMRELAGSPPTGKGKGREPIDQAMREVVQEGIPGWPPEIPAP